MTFGRVRAMDEDIEYERRRRKIALATQLATFVPANWPRLREAVQNQDRYRLVGLGLTLAAQVPLAISDLNRVPKKVENHRLRREVFAALRRGERPGQPAALDRQADLAVQIVGTGTALAVFAVQFRHARRRAKAGG
jgi:hypothetical protein